MPRPSVRRWPGTVGSPSITSTRRDHHSSSNATPGRSSRQMPPPAGSISPTSRPDCQQAGTCRAPYRSGDPMSEPTGRLRSCRASQQMPGPVARSCASSRMRSSTAPAMQGASSNSPRYFVTLRASSRLHSSRHNCSLPLAERHGSPVIASPRTQSALKPSRYSETARVADGLANTAEHGEPETHTTSLTTRLVWFDPTSRGRRRIRPSTTNCNRQIRRTLWMLTIPTALGGRTAVRKNQEDARRTALTRPLSRNSEQSRASV